MEQVDQILARCTGYAIEEITADKHLIFDLMADSVALIDIALEVEGTFGFTFTEGHMQQFATVADLYRLVEQERTI